MIVGDLTAGARNQLEKAPSRYCTSASPKIPAKIQRLLFCQMTRGARRATRGEPPGRQMPPGRGPPLGRAWGPPGGPGSPPAPPFRVYHPSDLKIIGGRFEEIFRRRLGGGNHRERKSSPAGRNLPGKFLPGEGRSSPSSSSSSRASSGSSSTSSSPTAPSSPQLHSVPLLHLGLYLL